MKGFENKSEQEISMEEKIKKKEDGLQEDNPSKEPEAEENTSSVEENASAESESEPASAPAEEASAPEANGEEAEAEEETPAASSGESGKSSFRKKEKKKKKDAKEEKIEDLTDKLARQMAEFDNFRKRTEKEKSRMYEIGAGDVITKILPVLDSFELGLKALGVPLNGEDKAKDEAQADSPEKEPSSEAPDKTSITEGMEKIYKQLSAVLEELGVQPIPALGEAFDPNLHNAVMHIEDENLKENTVAEEFQKGYTYRDTVLRHSMVKVAN